MCDDNKTSYNNDSNILKQASLKATKKRLMLLSAIRNAGHPITAEEIFDDVSDTMNLSTVYRALNAMADKNILSKSIHMDGKTYYHFNDHIHKHELICSVCHKSVEVEDCPFDEIAELIAKKTGYSITGHNVEFTGICPECTARTKNKD